MSVAVVAMDAAGAEPGEYPVQRRNSANVPPAAGPKGCGILNSAAGQLSLFSADNPACVAAAKQALMQKQQLALAPAKEFLGRNVENVQMGGFHDLMVDARMPYG
jgi:hypothetical protein